MKLKSILIISVLSLILSSCTSWFGIGHENFKCPGDAEGGLCGSTMDIYLNRDLVMQKKPLYTKTPEKMTIPESLNDLEKIKSTFPLTKQEVVVNDPFSKRGFETDVVKEPETSDKSVFEGKKPADKEKVIKKAQAGEKVFKETRKEIGDIKRYQKPESIPVPVRRPERIQRVYIHPHMKGKDLVEGYWTYIVIDNGAWIMPDGRVIYK